MSDEVAAAGVAFFVSDPEAAGFFFEADDCVLDGMMPCLEALEEVGWSLIGGDLGEEIAGGEAGWATGS